MIDTDSCIYVIKNRPPALRSRFEAEADRLCISSITLMELAYGVAYSSDPARNRRVLTRFVSQLAILPFDAAAAEHAGEIRAELRRRGTPIGAYDALIAGHARANGLAVVTNNLREFERVPGLETLAWADGLA